MRTADGRIFLGGHEYHYVPCQSCKSPTLTKIENKTNRCEDCDLAPVWHRVARNTFGDGVARHWKRLETKTRS